MTDVGDKSSVLGSDGIGVDNSTFGFCLLDKRLKFFFLLEEYGLVFLAIVVFMIGLVVNASVYRSSISTSILNKANKMTRRVDAFMVEVLK